MKKGKKFGVALMLMWLFMLFPQLGQAAPTGALYLDGNSISLPEKITLVHSVTMIPVRVVSEQLGYKVDWDPKAKTVAIYNDSKRLTMAVDQKTATVDDKEVKLDVAPMLQKGTTLVPLRFIGENMGLTVDWDKETKSVYLFTADESSEAVPPTPGTPSGEDANGSGSNSEDGNSDGSVGGVVDPDALITGFSFIDNKLHIAASSNVLPSIMTMDSPDRVVIDFPKAVFSEEFFEKFRFDAGSQGEMEITDYPDVQRIRFAMFSDHPNTVRFVIDLDTPYHGKITYNESGLTTVELVPGKDTSQPKPPIKTDGKYTVVIDAGHGDHDSGAVSVKKRYEKDFNLSLALKVGEILSQDDRFNTVLSREDDTFLELSERAQLANSMNADLFVSIHANSVDNMPHVSGTETYYWRAESKAFAEAMHKQLMEGTQFKDRGVRKANHHVTRETKMPAILLEIGFLTNAAEEAQLFDEQFQQRVAEHIVKGILDYLGLS
ncbi:MAG: N-acetylmuramoyl-L-alanine amidase [Paenibacillus dendritiformis]|uniref:N-acetylmuramoyl-L-alanine amidase family protein n=1 Tax=uncultured Paenibacillus sp. TaxID=227322 RepID=UPI0025DEAA76|nr:N-acetylmuramoyl-L-alanine amidase family protein [uncultured Paenibacillus sp.]MDU5140645.1 N-acetylmuramoyl-L-alanine amidase [Paenibacillus dendritiformis]